jgi:hypothetical protein
VNLAKRTCVCGKSQSAIRRMYQARTTPRVEETSWVSSVLGRRALWRKGSLAALHDGAMFKVCYGWGLRRNLAPDSYPPTLTRGGLRNGVRSSGLYERPIPLRWGWADSPGRGCSRLSRSQSRSRGELCAVEFRRVAPSICAKQTGRTSARLETPRSMSCAPMGAGVRTDLRTRDNRPVEQDQVWLCRSWSVQ